ncbi:DNA primase [Candidatus Poribacteria bacterium]|nr:DNA primase [Candidatus Poribacteria bacterium]
MNSSPNHIIPREVIDDIRDGNDIVEVISELGIPLKPAGKDYKALCPFHSEKTPSFTVSTEKQIFNCFGCNTGGNVISFLQKHEGKSFREAIEWLAERIGASLPGRDEKSVQRSRKRLELQDLNRFAMAYFHKQLLTPTVGGRALAYLKNRGIKDKVIQLFQLGYTKPERRDLVKAATQTGFSIQQLVDVGLIKNEERGPTDRFRGRVIFPILDERGIAVGFGGRALSNELLPKYLNSPTTPLYDKSKILYNLHNARLAIQKTGTSILVEGYLDAIMLYQAGVENVVASLGTSLNESHASLLRRFATEVIIVYDGDSAGFQATLRGLHQLLKEGLRVRIVLLPPGEDPDLFVRNRGVDAFKALLNTAINLIEFQIQRAVQQDALRQVGVKAQAVKEISLTLSNVKSQVELTEYIKYTARELDIDKTVLWSELRHLGIKAARPVHPSRNSVSPDKKKNLIPRESIEWQLIEALIQCPDLISEAKEHLDHRDFTHPELTKVAQMLWEASRFENGIDIQYLIDTSVDEKIRGIISNATLRKTVPPNLKARVDGCLKKLKQFLLWDLERTVRSAVLTQGHNSIDMLAELVELSNRRRQFAP